MTIEKGKEWGQLIARPEGAPVATTDGEIVTSWQSSPNQPILLRGGDLYRSLGSPADRDPVMSLPIDLLEVTTDAGVAIAAAHVVVRNRWWRGRVVVVANTDFLGEWNVAPRAHPNDGRLDVVDVAAEMGWRQRWQARQRLPMGTHVPHRSIKVSSANEAEFDFGRPMRVFVDGRLRPPTRRMSVRVLPDAATVVA